MKMLIIENLKTGRADCGENRIPFPNQEILVEGKDFKTHEVESEELALNWLDKQDIGNLKIDDEATKKKIIEALELSNWIQKDAAKLLGIAPKAIWDRIHKFNIVHPDGRWFQKGGRKPKLKVMRKTG